MHLEFLLFRYNLPVISNWWPVSTPLRTHQPSSSNPTSRALAPDGLLILETEHPEALFSGTYMDAYGPEARMDAWDTTPPTGALQGWQVQVAWGDEDDEFDPVTQVLQRTVRVRLQPAQLDEEEGGERLGRAPPPLPASVPLELEEQVPQRMWTYQEMLLLAGASGFDVVGSFGAMDEEVGMDSDDAFRMVVVMRKQRV